MSSVVAFVPVRCNSKSIPFKNIKLFCGKPLVYWTLRALQDSKSVTRIFVATDCNEIKNVVMDLNFSKLIVYDRDAVNAQDTSSTESVLLEFLGKINLENADKLLLVQATVPFTRSCDFENALKILFDGKFDSLLTCVRVKKFVWTETGESLNYDFRNRPRRQDFHGLLLENGAFYVNSVENIRKFRNRLSGKIGVYVMPDFAGIDIDEPDDWELAENLMRRYILPNSFE